MLFKNCTQSKPCGKDFLSSTFLPMLLRVLCPAWILMFVDTSHGLLKYSCSILP